MLESGRQAWQSAGSEEVLVLGCWVLGVGGREEVVEGARMLLPSRTVWMTIASVDTLRRASTNYTAAQIWKSMSCQVWHSTQRDLMPLLQSTLLRMRMNGA